MKEASGEANMTVITIVLIGLVAAIATPLINGLLSNSSKSACCNANGGTWYNGSCYNSGSCTSDGKKTTCKGKGTSSGPMVTC